MEAKVAASLEPIWPLLPMPVTTTRPLMPPMISTARVNGSPNPFERAFSIDCSPFFSVAIVRRADSTALLSTSFIARLIMAIS